MANEAQIRSSLQILKDPLEYRSQPTVFNADVTGIKGPVPGAITASTAGTDVDLSELTVPGFCRLQNLDSTNLVDFGIWDPESDLFYPLGELQPGEVYVIRLSRNLSSEYGTTPSEGTVGPNTNRFRIKAYVAAVDVVVEAFEA